MKTVLTIIALICTTSLLAQTKYCGKMTSLSYQTDIFSIIRMGLVNYDRDPSFITIKDKNTIESVIAVVLNDPNYQHLSDMNDYSWDRQEDSNRYFICVEGTDLREYREQFYMDEVEEISIWINGKRVQ